MIVGVGVVLVVAMVGLGVQRFLKVHDAENQVASLKTQITSVRIQIPKYDKVQQERAEILGLASISEPIVTHEVYWPGVLTSLAKVTPVGGSLSFSGSANPPPVAATEQPACRYPTVSNADSDN